MPVSLHACVDWHGIWAPAASFSGAAQLPRLHGRNQPDAEVLRTSAPQRFLSM